MLAAILMLITAQHCAEPSFCPTREELKIAIQVWRAKRDWEMMSAANEADPNNITLITPFRLLRVTDVYCDEPWGEPRSINCHAMLHYSRSRINQISRLTRSADGWQIEESTEVSRDR
ncbi:MAG: hypothetical protein EOP62_23115 [Sphingomonadales bacterium]|nr:MAG: hypothetical protein EOP62_23115 [Sphingomonadales bacterium]